MSELASEPSASSAGRPAGVSAPVVAVRVGARSRVAMGIATLVGGIAFGWPFVVSPSAHFDSSAEAPLLFGVLLLLVLGVLLAQLADGGIDAKAVAMLGVLAAIEAALRLLGAGTAGLETMFFLLILAGRVLGPGFGFLLGAVSLFASALLSGGVGPWLAFQMFAAAWVGLGAGLLPRARGWREIALLASYGGVSALGYGFAVNLSFWPFALGGGTSISYRPGAGVVGNLHRYLLFDAATSLGFDVGRAVTNVVLICLTGAPILAVLRRAARRAAFHAPVDFAAPINPASTPDPAEPMALDQATADRKAADSVAADYPARSRR